MNDPFGLSRFVEVQSGVYDRALCELQNGRKTSHWIWFIFPQIAGLGLSGMSKRYALSGLDEAKAYLEHPILGPRLIECVSRVLEIDGKSARQILGGIDAIKFRSCLTLFSQLAGRDPVFTRALDKYFSGHPDPRTLEALRDLGADHAST